MHGLRGRRGWRGQCAIVSAPFHRGGGSILRHRGHTLELEVLTGEVNCSFFAYILLLIIFVLKSEEGILVHSIFS